MAAPWNLGGKKTYLKVQKNIGKIIGIIERDTTLRIKIA